VRTRLVSSSLGMCSTVAGAPPGTVSTSACRRSSNTGDEEREDLIAQLVVAHGLAGLRIRCGEQ